MIDWYVEPEKTDQEHRIIARAALREAINKMESDSPARGILERAELLINNLIAPGVDYVVVDTIFWDDEPRLPAQAADRALEAIASNGGTSEDRAALQQAAAELRRRNGS